MFGLNNQNNMYEAITISRRVENGVFSEDKVTYKAFSNNGYWYVNETYARAVLPAQILILNPCNVNGESFYQLTNRIDVNERIYLILRQIDSHLYFTIHGIIMLIKGRLYFFNRNMRRITNVGPSGIKRIVIHQVWDAIGNRVENPSIPDDKLDQLEELVNGLNRNENIQDIAPCLLAIYIDAGETKCYIPMIRVVFNNIHAALGENVYNVRLTGRYVLAN